MMLVTEDASTPEAVAPLISVTGTPPTIVTGIAVGVEVSNTTTKSPTGAVVAAWPITRLVADVLVSVKVSVPPEKEAVATLKS